MKEILFCCFTPYHLLTAMFYSYKIKKNRNIKATLIFINFKDYRISNDFYNSFFDKVFIVPYYGNDNVLIKLFKKSYYGGHLFSMTDIYKYVCNRDNLILCAFSDQEITTCKVMSVIQKNNNNIILIEDGLGIYIKAMTKYSILSRIGYFLSGVKLYKYIGESYLAKTIIAKNPELLDDRFKSYNKIKQSDFVNDDEFINRIVINTKDIIESDKPKILILGVPYETYSIPQKKYKYVLKSIADLNKDYDIYIKQHHMEDDFDVYSDMVSCKFLDDVRYIPVEVLLKKYKFEAIYTIVSKSVVNLAKICENSNIYILYELFDKKLPEGIAKEFSANDNIIVISDISELKAKKYFGQNYKTEKVSSPMIDDENKSQKVISDDLNFFYSIIS